MSSKTSAKLYTYTVLDPYTSLLSSVFVLFIQFLDKIIIFQSTSESCIKIVLFPNEEEIQISRRLTNTNNNVTKK